MTTICQCGQCLDDLEFDEECPGCLAERAEEERERRHREKTEDFNPYVFGFGIDGLVVSLERERRDEFRGR